MDHFGGATNRDVVLTKMFYFSQLYGTTVLQFQIEKIKNSSLFTVHPPSHIIVESGYQLSVKSAPRDQCQLARNSGLPLFHEKTRQYFLTELSWRQVHLQGCKKIMVKGIYPSHVLKIQYVPTYRQRYVAFAMYFHLQN